MGDMKQDNQGQQQGGNQATNREPAEGGRDQSQGQQGNQGQQGQQGHQGGNPNRPQGQENQNRT